MIAEPDRPAPLPARDLAPRREARTHTVLHLPPSLDRRDDEPAEGARGYVPFGLMIPYF